MKLIPFLVFPVDRIAKYLVSTTIDAQIQQFKTSLQGLAGDAREVSVISTQLAVCRIEDAVKEIKSGLGKPNLVPHQEVTKEKGGSLHC